MQMLHEKRVIFFMYILLSAVFLSSGLSKTSSTSSSESYIKELYSSNITNNLLEWETDIAIMFYSPRCTYCKQLLPSWSAIAKLTSSSHDLRIGKFNCEEPVDHLQLCNTFNIDRYPSIAFIGYGNFHQTPSSSSSSSSSLFNLFKKASKYPSFVTYDADLYPEAIYDWVLMLSWISYGKRKWNDFTSLFSGKSHGERKLATLKQQVETLNRKVQLFGNELEKYKAIELFDSLENYGDPFPLLHQLEPDQVTVNTARLCFVILSFR
jgi:hypothetical protein